MNHARIKILVAGCAAWSGWAKAKEESSLRAVTVTRARSQSQIPLSEILDIYLLPHHQFESPSHPYVMMEYVDRWSLWGVQLRSTTKPSTQWNIILAHMKHSKFNNVYILHCLKASLVVCLRLRNCMRSKTKIFSVQNFLRGNADVDAHLALYMFCDCVLTCDWILCKTKNN